MTLSLEQQEKQHTLIIESQNKKCSICNRNNVLIKLPDEFQLYAAEKNFVSYYCIKCCQTVNYLLLS